MGVLEGRVAIVTGAGRGLGRAYALAFADEGARVVVNDLGVDHDGSAGGQQPADGVVDEIRAAGGEATVDRSDVSSWDGAQALVATALDTFGELDILVNNAGILRDRALVNMTEDEWDDVIATHLKGHFAPSRFAASYWREQFKAGVRRPRNLIHTSSTSGLFANPGQSNYGAAKSGIASFSQIVARELQRYGVITNCVAPGARTRLTLNSPGLDELMAPTEDGFDEWDPANVAPLVTYLASGDCPFNGEIFIAQGGMVKRVEPWNLAETVEKHGRWTVADLAEALDDLAPKLG